MKLVGATGIEDRLQVSHPRDVWGRYIQRRIVIASFYGGGGGAFPIYLCGGFIIRRLKYIRIVSGRERKKANVELRNEF
jgi:hypothetical protein